jgi:SulP family sulfate permease
MGHLQPTAGWRGDIFGGLTTAVVSLPMALTFGAVSGLGPQAGLYGAILVGLFAAIFGGTRTLISEPTGPMTVMMTAIIARTMAADPAGGAVTAFTIVMVAGVFQVVFGVLKLGRYITIMPYSVISGFMSGIGVLLVLTQIGPILGHPTPGGGAVGTLRALPDLVGTAVPAEIILGVAALLALVAVPQSWRRRVPPQLFVLLVATVVSTTLLRGADLRRIGAIPMGLPSLVLPRVSPGLFSRILVDGLILAVLGAIDSLLTSMIADSLTRTHHDSNRELVGQGIGNIVSGLLGGLPGAGATMGTVVNIQVGGRTPRAGIIRAVILTSVVLVLAPLLESIPMAVLAAIAIKVGIDILDWSFLGRAHHISRNATLIMYGVMAMTIFVDLIVAVGVGVFIANILTIEELSNLPSTRVTTVDPSGDRVVMNDEERALLEATKGRVLLFHLSGPMIFGVAQAIAREAAAMRRDSRVLIVDLSDVSMLGTTVALALENVIRDALGTRQPVVVAAQPGKVRDRLARMRVLGPDVIITETRRAALEVAGTLVERAGT